MSSQEQVNAVTFVPGMCLRDVEQEVILSTLKYMGYNRTRTAKILGIGIRTLQRKLKKYQSNDPSTQTKQSFNVAM